MAVTTNAAEPLHWRVVCRNIGSNWSGYVVTVATGFVMSPVIVHSLGNTGYGIWTLVLSLTAYFGLLDLGIRSTVGRFVARYVARDDSAQVNRTVNTAVAILSCGSVVTLIATAILCVTLGSFGIEPQMASAAKAALVMVGVNVALALPMGAFASVLVGLERYDIVGVITILTTLAQAVLTFAALKAGSGIIGLAAIVLSIAVLRNIVMAVYAKFAYPALQVRWSFVTLAGFKELFGFSIFRFICISANQLIFYTDSVVIGAFLGAASITPYAIGGSLINYGRDVVSLATDAFYPAATRMDSLQNQAGLKSIYILCTRLSLLLGLPLCLGFIFLGRQFITLWMGSEYSLSGTILLILAIPQFTSLPQFSSALLLASVARHQALAFIAIAEGAANLALSIFLARKIGILGVAWGTVVPHLIATGIIVPAYTLRVLRLSVGEYLRKAWLGPVVCALPAGALCYFFSTFTVSPSWVMFLGEVAAVCAVTAVTAYFITLGPEQKTALRRRATAGSVGGYAK